MKKLLITVLIVACIAALLFFRSGPRKVGPVVSSNELHDPELRTAPSRENVSKSFIDHIELLKKNVASNPNDVRSLTTLAQWLMDAHRTEEAITYFERGLQLQPKNDSLLLDLSVCYFQIHQYDKAMNATDRILQFRPDHPRAMLNKGAIYAAQNSPDAAAATWNRLIRRSPDTEEAALAKRYLAQLRGQ